MNTLVTGANGFLGTHLVRALARRGHRVRGMVQPDTPTDSLTGLDLEVVPGDLMVLEPGMLVSADGRLVETDDLTIDGGAGVTMNDGSQLRLRLPAPDPILLPAITMAGDASIHLSPSTSAHHRTRTLDDAVTGPGTLTVIEAMFSRTKIHCAVPPTRPRKRAPSGRTGAWSSRKCAPRRARHRGVRPGSARSDRFQS